MTRSDNEQEFVLGNKQLLSAFFVVVMLLGVFFAMGYIVGHNTTSDGAAKKAAAGDPPPASASAAMPDSGASASPPPSLPADTNPAPQTMPAQTETVRPPVPERTESLPAEKPAERAPEKPSTHIESAPGHTYLQVSAVKRPAADSIVKTLKDKGFPALLGESSKPLLFRVLVGPYADTESLSKAKSDLKAMGFDAVVSK